METQKIEVDLKDALNFIMSNEFNNFLTNNTTLSNKLFIQEVLIKTIAFMANDVIQEQEQEDILKEAIQDFIETE